MCRYGPYISAERDKVSKFSRECDRTQLTLKRWPFWKVHRPRDSVDRERCPQVDHALRDLGVGCVQLRRRLGVWEQVQQIVGVVNAAVERDLAYVLVVPEARVLSSVVEAVHERLVWAVETVVLRRS